MLPDPEEQSQSLHTLSTIHSNQDVISLLKLIQSLCCSYGAKMQGVMATVASHKHLYTHYQKDGVNNHTYHWEFLAHVETLEHSHISFVFVIYKHKSQICNNPSQILPLRVKNP